MSTARLRNMLEIDRSGQSRESLQSQEDANRLLTGLAREALDENEVLRSEVKSLQLRLLELERKADTDPLVAVYNRRAFIREIIRAQTVMKRYDILSSLIYFDLNGFKAINDTYGHGIGDELLLQTGHILVGGVRECDMVARLGGDEFGVLLFKTDPVIAQSKAATLACRVMDHKVLLPTGEVSVSTSWGVAPCEADMSVEQILARADAAMYHDKKAKKKASN